MADALCREYHLGILPTDLLGIELSDTKRLFVNARILSHRNEQTKLASMNDPKSPNTQNGPSIGDKILAKRMKMEQDRRRAIKEYGF